jgi:2Fe-2S ferredoxin
MYTIKFNFKSKEREPLILHRINAGQTILEIALKHDIDLHHQCGGVCACATCHIYIEKGGGHLEEASKREEDFIRKALHPEINSRLGCQCLLVEKSGSIEVTIPDQSHIV